MSIISSYNTLNITKHILLHYNIRVVGIKSTDYGCDNSVFLLHSEYNLKYIFKIYETKKESFVFNLTKKLLNTENNLINQKPISSKEGKLFHTFITNNKICVLYNYIDGDRFIIDSLSDNEKISCYLSKFHSKNSSLNFLGFQSFIESEKLKLKFYLTKSVKENLIYYNPKRLYLYNYLFDFFKEDMFLYFLSIFPPIYGNSHGDVNCENIILHKGNLNFIDFDNLSFNSYQVYDLVSLLSKSKIITDKEHLKYFMENYHFNHPILKTMEIKYISIYAWSILFSINALLSTDYYTFEIKKHTPEWIISNLKRLFTILINSIEHSINQLLNFIPYKKLVVGETS